MSLDAILRNIQANFEKQLALAVDAELKQEMEKFGRMLETEIKEGWTSYLNSYSPKVYNRTGATANSIQYVGTKGTAKSGMTANVRYGAKAYDTYLKSYRIPFQAIDQGWSYNSNGAYRYHYYEGYDITSKVQNRMLVELPSYITLQMN